MIRMSAPLEFTRKAKIVFGDTAAAMMHTKPTTEEARIATAGTPRLVTRTSAGGASRRAARTNSIRDAVYMPEFRQLSTAVNTTAFIRWSAYGMPILVNAATNGEAALVLSFHGRITASRKIEPTKKMTIRTTTALAAFVTAFWGFGDSAAAMVATSAPVIEKITARIPPMMTPDPFGKNPPWAVRFEKSIARSGHSPRTKAVPMTKNVMIAATLIPANQNSNSPNDETDSRLLAVIATRSINPPSHSGMPGIQYWRILAPAMASKPTMITQ